MSPPLRSRLVKAARRLAYPFLSAEGQRRVRDEKFAEQVWQSLVSNPDSQRRIDAVLALKDNDPRLSGVLTEDERALPSDPAFQASGYTKTMFIRYGVAMHFVKGMRVLDTCSGLGWGAYLLDGVASELHCIELDRSSQKAAQGIWPYERTLLVTGSVMQLPYEDDQFDAVTAMESIEHFTLDDCRQYMAEVRRVLRPGGMLIGSTPLPPTIEEVEKEKRKNPFHLHVFRPAELAEFLSGYFEDVYVYSHQRYFRARKCR